MGRTFLCQDDILQLADSIPLKLAFIIYVLEKRNIMNIMWKGPVKRYNFHYVEVDRRQLQKYNIIKVAETKNSG